MQLGEIVEATIGVGKFANLFFKLLWRQVLPRLQLVAHNLTHLVGGVRIAQVVRRLAVEVIENLVTQRA